MTGFVTPNDLLTAYLTCGHLHTVEVNDNLKCKGSALWACLHVYFNVH